MVAAGSPGSSFDRGGADYAGAAYPGAGYDDGADIEQPPIDPSRLASVPRRFGALLIDGLLPLLTYIPILAVIGPLYPSLLVGDVTPDTLATMGYAGVVFYVALLGYMAYALVQMGQGRSPGKRILGLRVIYQRSGEPAGFWRMMLREVIGKWVSAIVLYLGFLWAIWDKQRQGWHDKIANTVVVREDAPDADRPVDDYAQF